MARLNHWNTHKGGESFITIREALRGVMQDDFGVFRQGEYMEKGLQKLDDLAHRLKEASMGDFSQVFNTTRIEALETENLMAVARATALSALTRTESRGAHSREDYPERDDVNCLKHTLGYLESGKVRTSDRPVDMSLQSINRDRFTPQERKY